MMTMTFRPSPVSLAKPSSEAFDPSPVRSRSEVDTLDVEIEEYARLVTRLDHAGAKSATLARAIAF